jgi:hypothetical protein
VEAFDSAKRDGRHETQGLDSECNASSEIREFESIGLRRSPAIVHCMHRCEAAEKSHKNGQRNAVLYRTGTKTSECLKTSTVRSEIINLPEIDVIKTVD